MTKLSNDEFFQKFKDRHKQEHPVYTQPKKEKKENNFKLTKGILWSLFQQHQPKGYRLDKRNEKVVYTVLRYFLQDSGFSEYGNITSEPSLQKGLLIFGDYGIGKSLLFEILHSVGRELVVKRDCKDVWFSQISAGSFVDQYMEAAVQKESEFIIKKYYKGKLYIDDLGFEKKAFNKTELFAELLFERYRNFSDEKFKSEKDSVYKIKTKTLVTTNLNPSQLTERYGERIGDRLPEMFNIIKWEGQSYRE